MCWGELQVQRTACGSALGPYFRAVSHAHRTWVKPTEDCKLLQVVKSLGAQSLQPAFLWHRVNASAIQSNACNDKSMLFIGRFAGLYRKVSAIHFGSVGALNLVQRLSGMLTLENLPDLSLRLFQRQRLFSEKLIKIVPAGIGDYSGNFAHLEIGNNRRMPGRQR